MRYDIYSNIRKNNLKTSILFFIFAAFSLWMTIMFYINDGSESWFLILFFGSIGCFMSWLFYKCFILVIDPSKSDIFKKYGTVEELEKIIEEIENTIEYEDKKIIIAENYVADKKDFEKILAYKDILRVHKLVHKTNFVIDRYDLVITDKYNFQTSYSYEVKEEHKVDELIILIGSKCSNAKLGYTREAESHIKKYKEDLPNAVSKNEEKYACPDCNEMISKNEKYCKNCGCKIDWGIDEEKNSSSNTSCILCKKVLP